MACVWILAFLFCPEVIARAKTHGSRRWKGGCTVAISGEQLAKLQQALDAGQEHDFYLWPAWRSLRAEVLRLDNYECQECRRRGRYRRAAIVHHVKHLRDRPDLALSIYDGQERQLESVCKRCHEALHPEGQRQYAPSAPPLTQERWD